MGSSRILLIVCAIILILEHVRALEIVGETNKDTSSHLDRIPRRFDVRPENAIEEFKKYVNDIHTRTANKNLTILYRVKVEVANPTIKKMSKKKKLSKKMKSKKYNIPLKKQNMKLSNFEVLMRKLAEENGQKSQNYELLSLLTTTKPNKPMTTKQIVLKYKPILRRVKTNYTKIVKPVRNKIITLTV